MATNLVDPIRSQTGWDKRTRRGSQTPGRYCYLCGRELKPDQKTFSIREDTSGCTRRPDEDIPEDKDMGYYDVGSGCARRFKNALSGYLVDPEGKIA